MHETHPFSILAPLLLALALACGGDDSTGEEGGDGATGTSSTTNASANSLSDDTKSGDTEQVMNTTGVECLEQGTWFPADDECNRCLCDGTGEFLGCTGIECNGPCEDGDVLLTACPHLCTEGRWQRVGDDGCSCDEGEMLDDGCDVCTCTAMHMWMCESTCDSGAT